MKNITYLIGAGASYNSMPIVSEISISIRIIKKLFILIQKQINSGGTLDIKTRYSKYKGSIGRLVRVLAALEELEKEHASIDTLFRKLHLTNNKEIKVKPLNYADDFIVTEKELLLSYNIVLLLLEFSVFDIEEVEKLFQRTGAIGDKLSTNEINYINSKRSIDLRYDAFLATILENNQGILSIPNSINILSWNYDIQFERSIANFLTNKNWPEINSILKRYNYSKETSTFNYFKLNGSIYDYQGDAKQPFHKIEFENLSSSSKQIDNILIPLLDSIRADSHLTPIEHDFSNQILFEWRSETQRERQKCFESIKDTDVLVVIGYSFPTFNRKTDRALYNSMKKLKKIYIQNTSDNIEDVTTSFKSLLNEGEYLEGQYIYELSSSRVFKDIVPFRVDKLNAVNDKYYTKEIVSYRNTNQFYIPPEY